MGQLIIKKNLKNALNTERFNFYIQWKKKKKIVIPNVQTKKVVKNYQKIMI